jgi:tetratricopeptide (TPR) repeat protein
MLGKAQEAAKMFQKALETSAPSLAPALQDVPAYYAVADAYAGLGDAAAAQARAAKTKTGQVDFLTKAEQSYSKSLEYWQKIPNPARLSPGIFLVQTQKEVAQNLERTKGHLEAARAQ